MGTQKRFFKSNDLYDLFTLNEGTSDKTETSAIFAGTNSEIEVNRNREKRKRQNDEIRDIAIKPVVKKTKEDHHKKKKKKKHKKKYAKFEGERVSHLDKTDVFKGQPTPEEKEKEQGDDYVLSRLFKKSGVHSALQHDVIMDGDGGADFALIDAEAERVAKEAVQRLRDSQRACFRATDGIPTWTGNNGLQKKPRFGKSSKKPSKPSETGGEAISANDLLQRMRERNRLMSNQPRSNFYEGRDLFQPEGYQGFEPNVELLTDIRNFVAFQNSSAGDGEATTRAIVEHFKEKLPPVKNPLFKALLNEICTFQKHSSASQCNVWRLKDEFR